MTDLLIIESKTIDLMMFDSMIVDSMLIDSLKKTDSMKTIESMMIDLKMTDSIERLIVVEKLLIELICTYVDASEIDSIMIEK